MRIFNAGRLLAVAIIGVFALGLGNAHATVVTTIGCVNVNQSCTLAELIGGGSLTISDKIFANWELQFVSPGPDLTRIEVIPLDNPLNPGLKFTGNDQLTTMDELHLDFGFSMANVGGVPTIIDNSLALTAFDFGGRSAGAGGLITIDEVLFDQNLIFLHDKHVEADNLFNIFVLFDAAEFAPQRQVFVEKNITLRGDGGSVTLDMFEQRFSQLPEPATLTLFGIGLAGLGFARWRRRKRVRGGVDGHAAASRPEACPESRRQ